MGKTTRKFQEMELLIGAAIGYAIVSNQKKKKQKRKNLIPIRKQPFNLKLSLGKYTKCALRNCKFLNARGENEPCKHDLIDNKQFERIMREMVKWHGKRHINSLNLSSESIKGIFDKFADRTTNQMSCETLVEILTKYLEVAVINFFRADVSMKNRVSLDGLNKLYVTHGVDGKTMDPSYCDQVMQRFATIRSKDCKPELSLADFVHAEMFRINVTKILKHSVCDNEPSVALLSPTSVYSLVTVAANAQIR